MTTVSDKINAQGQETKDAWNKMVNEQTDRIAAMCDEVAKLETKGFEQARQAIEETTKLVRTSLEYQMQLASEWRKLALDATRRAAEVMTLKS
jgi:hypothetical protein